MSKPASSRKKVPTEVWVALIGLVGVLATALLTSPLMDTILHKTPVPTSASAAELQEAGQNAGDTPVSSSAALVGTPKPVEESMVVITLKNGSVVQLPMSTLYTNFSDKALPLYNGVTIAFDKLQSVEVLKDEGENNITVTFILLDGTMSTERVDEYAADSGEFEGETSIGHFYATFHELKKIEFQR